MADRERVPLKVGGLNYDVNHIVYIYLHTVNTFTGVVYCVSLFVDFRVILHSFTLLLISTRFQ